MHSLLQAAHANNNNFKKKKGIPEVYSKAEKGERSLHGDGHTKEAEQACSTDDSGYSAVPKIITTLLVRAY